ncbi:MAG: leucine-rich repeat domain-containing protein, partial [Clostridia bacterium]
QGILMNKAKTAIISVPQSIKGDIVLPNTLMSIGSGAFSGCSGLTSITIPSSVTSIDSEAFAYCRGLKTINCEAASQPSGWNERWNELCNATVVWGYTGA